MVLSKALGIAAVGLSVWSVPGLRKQAAKHEVAGSHFKDESGSRRTAGNGASFGVAMADVDGDGDVDIFVTNSESANELYLNKGNGEFADATQGSGLEFAEVPSRATVFADVNNDGRLDVFISAMQSSNRLLLGDGTGRFEDVTASSGLSDKGPGQGSCFADIDGDGDLDLFVANFGESDRMYLNDGYGSFADVTDRVGVRSDGVNGFGCVFGDFDEDGDMDLYVNNDGAFNNLYINNGQGVFTDLAEQSGAQATTGGGRGVQMADFNGDGHWDLYAVVASGKNTYLLGNGDGTFVDATEGSGLDSQKGVAQGLNVADFDGDGDIDIIVSVLNRAHAVYENDGAGNFNEISSRAGAGSNRFGQGVAFGDLNGDGALDALVASWGGFFPLCPFCRKANNLLMNQVDTPAWLKVRPVGRKGATLIGAEVSVMESASGQAAAARAQIDGGSAFCSQNAYEAYFGLSAAVARGASTFDVVVHCSGGLSVFKSDLAPNQVVEVRC